jgi:hypothetical protein
MLAQVVRIQNFIGGGWFKFWPQHKILLLKFSVVGPSDCMQMRECLFLIELEDFLLSSDDRNRPSFQKTVFEKTGVCGECLK